MSRNNHIVNLRHMLDHAKETLSLVQGKNRADLDSDRLLNLSVVRLLEIIGEAAGRVAKEQRCRMPGIPWSQIINLRHRLIHGYDKVDFGIVWKIVTQDLPQLIAQLEKIIPPEEPEA